MPLINLATLHGLIHLFKFKFTQVLKWSIILDNTPMEYWSYSNGMKLDKYTFFNSIEFSAYLSWTYFPKNLSDVLLYSY